MTSTTEYRMKLPNAPVLRDKGAKGLVEHELDVLLRHNPHAFDALFLFGREGYISCSEVNIEWLTQSHLVLHGILHRAHDRLTSRFCITRWRGIFVFVDRVPTCDPLEVFPGFTEDFVLSAEIGFRQDEFVLDIGTGAGTLVLDAALHGARGLGVDLSERALTFARWNADVNGVDELVEFTAGDFRLTSAFNNWGRPDRVLCNPPFEAVPPGIERPLHSNGGALGDTATTAILSGFYAWEHRPQSIHIALSSLGRAPVLDGSHLLVMKTLRQFCREYVAYTRVMERVPPLTLHEYASNLKSICRDDSEEQCVNKWLDNMLSEGIQSFHILVAHISPHVRQNRGCLVWSPFAWF